jgi:hypothetical protein
MSSAVRAAIVLLGAGMIISGCTRAQAKVDIPPPPLDVPAPPPRVVQATESEVAQPVGLAADPANGTPALPPAGRGRGASPPATGRSDQPSRPPAADSTRPDSTSPPAATDAKPDEPRPTPTLRAAPTQQEEALAASIRSRLTRATNQLQAIDYGRLSADARDQYDRAKSFVREADDALRARNLPYAQSLTDKAVALAAQLGGR